MPLYFTVDRAGRIQPGLDLGSPQRPDLQNFPDLAAHFERDFPQGVTEHGQRYLNTLATERDSAIELVWEYVRRAHFPDRPSRLTSAFAWRTLEEAKAFRASAGVPLAKVWAVDASEGFVANMSLLNIASSTLRVMQLADLYWNGKEGPTGLGLKAPNWEVLLSGSVTVVGEV
ncbi:hypothetical protein LJR296_008234 [Cupriavidus necator]